MTQAPQTLALGHAVAVAEAIGRPDLFGKGVPLDPLFPIRVTLSGQDGNSYWITSTLERAVRAYLRKQKLEKRFANPLIHAIRRELWSARSYDELLTLALCLADVR